LECLVDALAEELRIDARFFENGLHRAAGLFDQREQEMLRIELRVAIALNDFMGARKRVLRSFGESLESHHGSCLFSNNNYNLCLQWCQWLARPIFSGIILGVSEPNELLEVTLGKLLTEKKWTLAIAESCTGGLVTHRLTNVPGSSAYVIVSVIAYAYEAKVRALGVSWDTLNKFGAVSEETVCEMARGARERFDATLGLAITGIAGPGGGTPEKPVGLTYFGLASADGVFVEKNIWQGSRLQIKEQSAQAALMLLKSFVEQH
jgi:PncC family amidohydrolase